MRKFEYKHGIVKAPSSDELEKELNALGADGWEVVEMRREPVPQLRRNPPGTTGMYNLYDYEFVFKREIL
jgi:hypothetical protein